MFEFDFEEKSSDSDEHERKDKSSNDNVRLELDDQISDDDSDDESELRDKIGHKKLINTPPVDIVKTPPNKAAQKNIPTSFNMNSFLSPSQEDLFSPATFIPMARSLPESFHPPHLLVPAQTGPKKTRFNPRGLV